MNDRSSWPDGTIQPEGERFQDDDGRTLILRGANLGGSSKIPFLPEDTDLDKEALLGWQDVSFVGRPFPLDQAEEHLSRLKSWGFTFLRWLVTWEAIEHAGPGIYDEAYLDYLHAVIRKAGEQGISVFIDPHQDTWSRWTGGDGAPAWTLTRLGIDLDRIGPTGAALLRQDFDRPFQRMVWPSNSVRYGAATLFTLFFAGNDFAPETLVDGQPVQEFLQAHFIASICQVARRLADLGNVVGFDSLNEPWLGFIGQRDCSRLEHAFVRDGVLPTPFQAMTAASGFATEFDVYRLGLLGSRLVGRQLFNPDGVRLFREGFQCPWLQHGVWRDCGGETQLLKPDYFRYSRGGALADGSPPPKPGTEVDFSEHYLKPFLRRTIAEIRTIAPKAIFFLEGVADHPLPTWSAKDPGNVVMAFHWYDGITLALKRYDGIAAYDTATRRIELGPRRSFRRQLAGLKDQCRRKCEAVPPFLGEFGLPFDMHKKRAYRTGDFTRHEKALAAYYDAIDASLLSCTIWNYTADNTNERGDRWNDEDLSIFSRDQQHLAWTEGIDSGGRAVRGFCRPYARRTAGTPLAMRFDLRSRRFEYRFRADPAITAPTEIYVPRVQYPEGYWVETAPANLVVEKRESEQRLLAFGPTEACECHLVVVPTGGGRSKDRPGVR